MDSAGFLLRRAGGWFAEAEGVESLICCFDGLSRGYGQISRRPYTSYSFCGEIYQLIGTISHFIMPRKIGNLKSVQSFNNNFVK